MRTATTTKERPILMCGEMVRATLREQNPKTQTRRTIKPTPWEVMPPKAGEAPWAYGFKFNEGSTSYGEPFVMKCPYGATGDELFVKETWRTKSQWDGLKPSDLPIANEFMVSPFIAYDADGPSKELHGKTRPSIFMPRWASRITLEIESVRVERLHDISEEDALAEGIDGAFWYPHYGAGYMALWESINGPGSWSANPYVWAITFKRV